MVTQGQRLQGLNRFSGLESHLYQVGGRIRGLAFRASRLGWWTVFDQCGQATKGIRWMTWRTEAKKDGVASEMLREAGKQAMIRRSPNAATHITAA